MPKPKKSLKNLFTTTRFRLDIIAAVFVFFILFAFSYVVYNLLTEDIIFQISPVFKYLELENNFNTKEFFSDLQKQTLFLLIVSDVIIFVLSIVFFDRMVKRMLKPVEYVSNLQSSFASNVSHELRTPLAIMNMRGEILMSKIEKAETKNTDRANSKFVEETKEGVSVILKEVTNLANILDDLLFEARIKYREEKVEEVSLAKVESLLRKSIQNQLYLKSEAVTYAIQLEAALKNKYVQANPLHLERIFNNLISNSFKFTTAGSIKIVLENYFEKNKEYLRITITDTGLGISQEELAMVSERFYRGKDIENEISGSGIGLSIVQDIIHKYHWTFKIKSPERNGTIVSISKINLF